MNRSRIIRGIVTVIFLIFSIALIVSSINLVIETKNITSLNYKLIYILSTIMSLIFYGMLKRKLKSANCKPAIEYFYRYIYLLMLVLITRFVAVLLYKDTSSIELIKPSFDIGMGSYLVYFLGKLTIYPLYATIIINTITTCICAFIIKRLIFNITTNEYLSAMASMLYIFVPQGIINTTVYNRYGFNLLFTVLGVYLLLKIIDEVKQHKLKNNKYLKLTIFTGICILLDILCGGRFEKWLVISIAVIFITNNIDYMRIKHKREYIEKFGLSIRKFMYKLESITINKLIIVSLILISFTGVSLLISQLIGQGQLEIYRQLDINTCYENLKLSLSGSKTYYLVVLAVLVVLETLGYILRRKKDTKTTLLKICYILTLCECLISYHEYNFAVFDIFMVITLILSLGNIYYNREEKVKLLKSSN